MRRLVGNEVRQCVGHTGRMRRTEPTLRGSRLLDVDTPLRTIDHPQTVARGVDHDGKISLCPGYFLLDQANIYLVPLQPLAKKAPGSTGRFLRRIAAHDPTDLAASAHWHLRLHHPRAIAGKIYPRAP